MREEAGGGVPSPEPAVGVLAPAGTCQGRLWRHFVIGSPRCFAVLRPDDFSGWPAGQHAGSNRRDGSSSNPPVRANLIRVRYDDAVAVLEDAAQIPAYRLAQDVAIEKILAALAATRDGQGNPSATP